MDDEQAGELFEHVLGVELSLNPDRQALPGELVDDTQHSIDPSTVGPILDEIVAPDVAGILRPEPNAGAVV
jgi:hypothetical protein